MKIYFTASVLQKNEYNDYYQEIIDSLQKKGHKVIHEHVTESDMDFVNSQTERQNREYYQKVQGAISNSDMVVAEVSFPSTLNIGHEITLALSKNKPVICLYLEGKISAFFNGIKNDKLIYESYNPKTLKEVVLRSFETLSGVTDTRFNFYISPEIGNYLDWVSQHKKLPRAVFLRSLLEKSMKTEKDFKNQ